MKHSCVGSLCGLLFLLVAVVMVASGSAWSLFWLVLAILYLWQPSMPEVRFNRDYVLAAACLIAAASYYALMVLR